jgi:hypothetical protein
MATIEKPGFINRERFLDALLRRDVSLRACIAEMSKNLSEVQT